MPGIAILAVYFSFLLNFIPKSEGPEFPKIIVCMNGRYTDCPVGEFALATLLA